MIRFAMTASAIFALAASGALAQDVAVYGGTELEFTFDENGPDTGTATYLSGYLELERNGFYGGIWGQVADDDTLNEVDLYLGFRNELASGVSYDFGYTRYIYPNDGGNCCGEVTASLGVPIGDKLSTTLDLAYDPDSELGNAYVELAYQATDRFGISANYGVYEVEEAPSEQEWDFGVTYSLTDEAALDLRYYDGSEYEDSYIGLSLAYDTTIFTR
jgi:uncharacterized protein (TIGR02001 family)